MAVLIDVVTRLDTKGLNAAQKQLSTFATKALKDSNAAGHGWAVFGQQATRVGTVMANTGKSMTKYLTVPIVAMGILAVRSAMKQQQAFAVLDLQTKSNTKATKAQTQAVDAWIVASAEATGIAVSELTPAMGRLEIATKNRTKAEQLMKLAEDMSAGSHKSLSVVAIALSRAYQGTTTSLARMGIKTFDLKSETVKVTKAMALASGGTLKVGENTQKVIKVQEAWRQLLPKLIKAYGGDAAKAANTTAGRFQRFGVAVHELGVQFGSDLLPLVNKALGFFVKLSDRFSKMSPGTRKLIEEFAGVVAIMGPVIFAFGELTKLVGGISTAIGIFKYAAAGGTKAMALLDLAMDANPIVLIGLAIVGLVAAFVVLWVKCKWFRDFWKAVWGDIEKAGKWVWARIGSSVTAYFELYMKVIKTALHVIEVAWSWTWNNVIKPVVEFVWNKVLKPNLASLHSAVSGIAAVIKWLAGVWSTQWNLMKTALDVVWKPMKAIFDAVEKGLHAVGSAASWLFGSGGTATPYTGKGPSVLPGGGGSTVHGTTALAAAETFMGTPYAWGGASRKGVDCSGLTMLAYQAAGVSLPHGATAQSRMGKAVKTPAPGDLVFFGSPSYSHHVGISLGGDRMIDAAHTGTNVRVDPLFSDYWGARSYDGGGYLQPGATLAINNTGRAEPVGSISNGGDSYSFTFSGPIYASSPRQAQQSASAIATTVIRKLAAAKRTTGRGR